MNSIRLDRITLPKIGLDRICLPHFGVPESEGSAVLPPELKKSLVCWYSPRKQRLTEYDVVESYVTDFNTVVWDTGNDAVSVTSKTITINKDTNNSLLLYSYHDIPDYRIEIHGMPEGGYIIYHYYQDGELKKIGFQKDGVYKLPAAKYSDISISAKFTIDTLLDYTGCTITQLPTSTAKDYSGNGHDLYLYGFQGKLNSGIGVYKHDFTTWLISNEIEKTPFTIKKRFNNSSGGDRYVATLKSNVSIEPFKVKCGITGTHASDRVKYVYITENGDIEVLFINNGEEVVVPKSYAISDSSTYIGFQFTESGKDDCEITITQIPDYPNQLCHSGKEYGVAYDMPILTDYTVIAKRTWFEQNEFCVFSSKSLDSLNGAFTLELIHNGRKMIKSFGEENEMDFSKDEIIYLSKNKYSGIDINSDGVQDYNELTIGRINSGVNINYTGCWSDYLLFDRTLTDEEIDYVKYNLIDTAPAPRPDVYYDLSKKNNDSPTRNIIEDLSGNGRDAEIFNMAYAKSSGYGKYLIDMTSLWGANISTIISTSNRVLFTKSYIGASGVRIMKSQVTPGKSMTVRFKLKGLKEGQYIITAYDYFSSEIDRDERHHEGDFSLEIPAQEVFANDSFITVAPRNKPGYNNDYGGIELTLLPEEYEGALVFDGIDDYAQMGNGNLIKPFKTLFMEVVPMDMNKILYDQRMDVTERGFAILLENNVTAFNGRNSGKTYINGKLNDTLRANDLLNKHQVITIVNPTHPERSKIFIGCNFVGKDFYANMALYKLIGFYEELTPEEIKKVIYKYKLNYEKI